MNQPLLSKDFLIQEYINKEKAMKLIAKENNVAVGTVFNYLKKYNIPTRKKLTEDALKRMSLSRKGKPSPLKGTHLSEERKRHLSIVKTGQYKIKTKYGGHKKKRSDGYIAVYCPSHKKANTEGYVMEHILVAEEFIGRSLLPGEVVHHKNRIRDDNRIENLQVMTVHDHMSYHMKERHKQRRDVLSTT